MVPPIEAIVLNRLAFGPRPGDVERLKAQGWTYWLDEQLKPDDANDVECNRRLGTAKLRISYGPGKEKGVSWKKLEENRPLSLMNKPIGEIWHLADYNNPMPYQERVRPFQEVKAATWMRAVYSKWQLREVMADFWHNHFNVSAEVDEAVQLAFPTYDRDVIRKHAFGNFREFIESVAKSVAMLRYLNNNVSRASPANENYARELLELHTLGSEHYLNALYNRWRDVPGATEGKPTGYIDQDVYETARAFTGWTYGGGQWARDDEHLPNNGEFLYYEPWHDNYQKRVLATEFDPNQPPMADGRRVLDLLCAHPATARHLCLKLCRRLVADDPPESLVAVAVDVWTRQANAPDQIAQTIRAIATSDEFAATWGRKVKRPLEFVASLLRCTEVEFTPDGDFMWTVDQSNQRIFNWPAPDGHPDSQGFWLGASTMLARWKMPVAVTDGWFHPMRTQLMRAMPNDQMTCRQVAEFWAIRVLGYTPADSTLATLVEFASHGTSPDALLPGGERENLERIGQLVALVAMTPEFHLR
ncbi:DUF1800 domain-containing protein [soil metagenome]